MKLLWISIEETSGSRLQVDFGHEQTALIHEWQVVKELSEVNYGSIRREGD